MNVLVVRRISPSPLSTFSLFLSSLISSGILTLLRFRRCFLLFHMRESFLRLKRINFEDRISIDRNHFSPRSQSRSIEEIRFLQKECALKRATTDWNYHIGRGTGLLISVFSRAEAGKNAARRVFSI